jgi:UrcA family protein
VTTAASSRIADVSLADLNLSTSEGMRAARERLDAMAHRICAGAVDGYNLSAQPNFLACVDSTLASTLHQLDALRQLNATVRNSVTRGANVSLADLDLSTPEGWTAARERLRTMSWRLCTQLARSNNLSHQPNFDACVDHTLAGALAQAKALAAAARDARTAQRLAP